MIRPIDQLRTPGPTPLPARVVAAAGRQMISHRGRHFGPLLGSCIEGLRWALQTTDDVLLFPASGTGGLEAAVANLLSPGEHVVICTMGWFGDLWAGIAERYGAVVTRVRAPWGSAIDPDRLADELRTDPSVRKVFITHNETSTGVSNDVEALVRVAQAYGCLTVVDSVSGAGCLPLAIDRLGLDVVVTSSQKGWLSPPGLTMITVSSAALEAAAEATCPRSYFDFHLQKCSHDQHLSATTPPLSVMYALQEALVILREEGRERIWERHHRVGEAIRTGVQELGLQLFADPDRRSDTVTAVRSPFTSAAELHSFLAELELRHRLVLAEAYGPLQGNVFRIGHLGAIDDEDASDIVERLGRCLRRRSYHGPSHSFRSFQRTGATGSDAAQGLARTAAG